MSLMKVELEQQVVDFIRSLAPQPRQAIRRSLRNLQNEDFEGVIGDVRTNIFVAKLQVTDNRNLLCPCNLRNLRLNPFSVFGLKLDKTSQLDLAAPKVKEAGNLFDLTKAKRCRRTVSVCRGCGCKARRFAYILPREKKS
jgi:hypothetical protein